ncbi:MAG: ABC transporter ATP-binding protein [Chloroflexi bacterium]|nr:ABC transporter ATP-binding protein [Chloroflexota bacterium]MDA1002117.1 ABC transporter ATP-binding protein [Chloroflexota bacterium]
MAMIETDALTKRYPGVNALDELTVTIEPGIVGLVGVNGAGKSTLIKILLGLVSATAGTASVLGFDVASEGTDLRQRVGYMPEHDCLPLEVSATEFVAHMAQISGLPPAAARERTAETLRHVGLFEERYRQMSGYSTGMKQRVKLAQALVHDPQLILLDEPTNGLDPAGRDEMLELVARTGHTFGINIIMATHLLGEIERVCDGLVLIDAGRLVHQGSVAEFTAATPALDIEVDRDADRLAARLRTAGLTASVDGDHVLVTTDGAAPYDVVRDAVVELGLGLVRMQHRRRTLEQLFGPVGAADAGEAP